MEQFHYGTNVQSSLDDLQVQCNDDEAMTSFKLRVNHESRKIFYELQCCKITWVTSAQEVENALSSSGQTKELTKQNVQCPNNAAINEFKLKGVAYGFDWRYVYK